MLYAWNDPDRLRRVWVDEISFERLYGTKDDRERRLSLFSADAIDELARVYLAPTSSGSSHPSAPQQMSLAFALTNLNGVSYNDIIPLARRAIARGASLPNYPTEITFFADSAIFRVEGGAYDPQAWDQIRRAAAASGAFPVAFPARTLTRIAGNLLNPPPLGMPPISLPHDFTYTDGGVLNNEPLGLARDLIARRGDDGERWYILIDPYYSDKGTQGKDFTPDKATFLGMVQRLVTILTKSASAADWLTVQKVNNYLDWYANARALLLTLLERAPVDNALAVRIDEVANRLATQKWGTDGPVRRAGYGAQVDSLLATEAEWYRALGRTDPRRIAIRDLFFILENAAGLRGKSMMRVVVVAPEIPGALAGDFLANFGAFFRRDWRYDDYLHGRVDAKEVLETTIFAGRPYPSDPSFSYVRPPRRDYSYNDIDPDQRDAFEGLLKHQVGSGLKEMGVGWLARKFAVWFLTPKLVSLLEKL